MLLPFDAEEAENRTAGFGDSCSFPENPL